ncbi:MAG: right-handed parallel beta-helix repeat-containing protein, partial [Candidatus Hodarchaeales archaeon]
MTHRKISNLKTELIKYLLIVIIVLHIGNSAMNYVFDEFLKDESEKIDYKKNVGSQNYREEMRYSVQKVSEKSEERPKDSLKTDLLYNSVLHVEDSVNNIDREVLNTESVKSDNIPQYTRPLTNNRQLNPKKLLKPSYATHDPIRIDGNTEFETQVGIESCSGDGSVDNPFIIEDYNITGVQLSDYLIDIQNTDYYFIINNLLLENGARGLFFKNVVNGIVTNVYSTRNEEGFFLEDSQNNTFFNNTAYDNLGKGFYFGLASQNNNLTNNMADYNENGFYLESDSSNNVLNANAASYNTFDGVRFSQSGNNTLTSNTAFNNGENGFYFQLSSTNKILNNTAYNNNNDGFKFDSSSRN